MDRDAKVDRVICEGKYWIERLRSIQTEEEFEKIESQIFDYMDFAAENFGEETDWGDEKDSNLNATLSVAWNWKRDTFRFKGDQHVQELFEGYLRDFEEYLNSKEWVNYGDDAN